MYHYIDNLDLSIEDIILEFIKSRKLDTAKMETEEMITEHKDPTINPREWKPEEILYEQTTKGNEVKFSDSDMRQINTLKRIYSPLTKEYIRYVNEVLEDYNFRNSPIYDRELDEKLLKKLVESSLKRCAEKNIEVHKILSDRDKSAYSRYTLLHSLFEFLLLGEIFLLRRMRERKITKHEAYMTF